jgi:hypothetical protein
MTVMPSPKFNFTYFDGLLLGMQLFWQPSDGRSLHSDGQSNNTVETLQVIFEDRGIFVNDLGDVASFGNFKLPWITVPPG